MSDSRLPRRRLLLLLAGIGLWSLAVVGRMVQVQVYHAEDLRELASRQHSSTVELDPVRGAILDRHGEELALTRDLRSVYAVPGLVVSADRTATALARALGADRRKILARLHMTDRNFVWVARKVTDAQAEAVEALKLPGIAFLEEPRRFYPKQTLAAHLLGYVGLDNAGLAGLEQQFDEDVRGIPGIKLTLRDARGVQFLPDPGGAPAEPGRNLVLALDASIQYIAERELKAAIEEHGAKGGTALVMDPWNGDILAMAGEPTFDPNRYAEAPPASRRNPAVQEAYEPGSTFKVITFAAALERNRLGLDERIDCGRGGITIAGTRIRDHESFDILSPTEIIAHSSNVGAILVGSRLEPDEFYHTMRTFGFGAPTGVDLPGEAAGLLRRPGDWSAVSRASISMGQEVGVTPLQLIAAVSAIANGGTLVRPRLVLRVEDTAGAVVREYPPAAIRRAIDPAIASTLTGMMEEVLRVGTAKAGAIDGLQVAGKTGTAQKVVGGTYAAGHYVASFVGFAPSRDPRVAVLVTLDEPRGGLYYGGLIAAPCAKRILEPVLGLLGVPAEGRSIEVTLRDYYPPPGDPRRDRFPSSAIARR